MGLGFAPDIKEHEYHRSDADEFVLGDLRDPELVNRALDQGFDEVWQLAADMGGAGYIFTGENDTDIMHNSAMINLNIVHRATEMNVKQVFTLVCLYVPRI